MTTEKNYFEMRVTRHPDRQVDYVVEVSSDQRVWERATDSGTLIEDTLWELRVRDGIALEDTERRFIRLTVQVE